MSSLSLTPTTLRRPITFPQGFSTARNTRMGVGLIVSAQLNDDALKMKYEKAVKDVEPLATKYLDANKKRIERRVEMCKEDAIARNAATLAKNDWDKKRQEVRLLQRELGIFFDRSSACEDEAFMSLNKKFNKLKKEVAPASRNYAEAWVKRIRISTSDESEEELLAWEVLEKKKLELMELQAQMYNLIPGMEF